MKDGRQLTPKQFIENEIPKLEQKYNINIKKLLEENIVIEKEEKINKNKNNIEQRSTTPDNSKNEQYNVDILKNINKDILNKKMQIGEGKEITYKEYLEKYVMHKMPKGEKIKLKNGIEIPTKQYIEEVLLQEKSKYGLNIDSMLADTIKDYAKKENEKTKSINTNNIRNNVNGMDFKDNVIEEAKISNDGFKDNTDKEKIQKVLLETEKTNLPMKIGFFEKIKQSFKKIKEIAHKVKEWIDKKKDSFFRENIKLVDIDLKELEKSETKDNSNKAEEKEIIENKDNTKVEKNIVEEEKAKSNVINEDKEIQNNIWDQKITNSEILENEAVKEKIEEYMKNLNNKVENSNRSKKKDKDLEI